VVVYFTFEDYNLSIRHFNQLIIYGRLQYNPISIHLSLTVINFISLTFVFARISLNDGGVIV